MKHLQVLVLAHKRGRPSHSQKEGDLLWKKGLLGDRNPQALVDTMVIMNGLYFTLHSGSEHRQLQSDPCRIKIVNRQGQHSYLEYTEDMSKNRPGGIKGRKNEAKSSPPL